jgi:hypothetical protein
VPQPSTPCRATASLHDHASSPAVAAPEQPWASIPLFRAQDPEVEEAVRFGTGPLAMAKGTAPWPKSPVPDYLPRPAVALPKHIVPPPPPAEEHPEYRPRHTVKAPPTVPPS